MFSERRRTNSRDSLKHRLFQRLINVKQGIHMKAINSIIQFKRLPRNKTAVYCESQAAIWPDATHDKQI